MLSAHAWTIAGICAGLVAGMAAIIWFGCDDEPSNGTGGELAAGPDEDEPDGMLAAA